MDKTGIQVDPGIFDGRPFIKCGGENVEVTRVLSYFTGNTEIPGLRVSDLTACLAWYSEHPSSRIPIEDTLDKEASGPEVMGRHVATPTTHRGWLWRVAKRARGFFTIEEGGNPILLGEGGQRYDEDDCNKQIRFWEGSVQEDQTRSVMIWIAQATFSSRRSETIKKITSTSNAEYGRLSGMLEKGELFFIPNPSSLYSVQLIVTRDRHHHSLFFVDKETAIRAACGEILDHLSGFEEKITEKIRNEKFEEAFNDFCQSYNSLTFEIHTVEIRSHWDRTKLVEPSVTNE